MLYNIPVKMEKRFLFFDFENVLLISFDLKI